MAELAEAGSRGAGPETFRRLDLAAWIMRCGEISFALTTESLHQSTFARCFKARLIPSSRGNR